MDMERKKNRTGFHNICFHTFPQSGNKYINHGNIYFQKDAPASHISNTNGISGDWWATHSHGGARPVSSILGYGIALARLGKKVRKTMELGCRIGCAGPFHSY
jgi:hypothetical protein